MESKNQNESNNTSSEQVPSEPELSAREDPANPLALMRKQVDIDTDFFNKFWLKIDPFDATKAQADYEIYKKFFKILTDEPTLFRQPQNEEMSREESRILTHNQVMHYFHKCRKILPINEVLTNVEKINFLLTPICSINQEASVKMTVSLQLAYKTIQNLGTEKHTKWLQRMEKGQDLSCFALTELAHGSNVRGILTTATYDHGPQEFILNSPCKEAMKFWIGGAGKTSNSSVVWAQLIVNGQNQGPHAFIVPLRDRKNHMALPGITIGDCGKKQGNEGIDNGFILFDNFRIPKENFLNRLSDINEKGEFVSPIASADQRFALSMGGLVTGRIILIGNMNNLLQHSLKIAMRFSVLRKQFGDPKSNTEQSLIDYQLHQYRLFPYVAQAFSLRNMEIFIREQWGTYQKKIFKQKSSKLAELHAIISSIKAIASWSAFDACHECRLSCGGLGYSYYSKFAYLQNAIDINCTWEGDNNVLLQQTAKFLLDQYKAKMKNTAKQSISVNWVTTDDVTEQKCQADTIEDFLKPENLQAVFEYRCNKFLQKTAMSMGQKLMDKSQSPFLVWNDEQVFGAQNLALAYGELCMLQIDTGLLKKMQSKEKKEFVYLKKDSQEILHLLFNLSNLTKIEKDIGTWYEHGYLNADQGEMIRAEIKNILGKMKRFTVVLSDSMHLYEDDLMDVMIAPNDGNLYGNIVKQLYNSPGVFQRISNWQDIVRGPKL